MLPIRRALLSVSDKTGLAELASGLAELGVEMISTGGTFRHLAERGLPVVPVSEVTGSPEILEGRVKTLHPRIHGGILADRAKDEHLRQIEEQGIGRIDLVVVNLYPFRETVGDPAVTLEKAVETIDVGGPTMVRAAAKNFGGVTVVVDPADYGRVLAALREGQGVVDAALRRELAVKAFAHTAEYDAAIAEWLERDEKGDWERVDPAQPARDRGGDAAASPGVRDGEGETAASSPAREPFPARLELRLEREILPRYGENPHQPAAVYRNTAGAGLLGGMRQHQGKQLSWNNVLDADAARRLVSLLAEPAVVIVKHNNPCGVGLGSTLAEAYERALATDPVSAFGSIIAVNRPADADFVAAMSKLFVEVLVAPVFGEGTLAALGAKEALRVLECPLHTYRAGSFELRAVDGGYLAQEPDDAPEDPAQWSCPTQRQPDEEELAALAFAWSVSRHVKSNAIVLANRWQTVGIGAGQMSRVDSCEIAVRKAQLPVAGSVGASDAFFPFRDGLDVLARAGVTAVAQPGGSRRDDEVIAAADEHGMAMLFTGKRHFKH